MHSNRIWWIFLSFLVAVTCWKSGEAIYRLYGYYRLTAHTQAEVTNWSVEKLSEERFLVKADYRFKAKGQLFAADYIFPFPSSLNSWAAEKAIQKMSAEKYQVWYSARNPLVSALQKNFPLKECLIAALMAALLLYFIWLGYYVASYGTHSPQK